MIFKQVWFGFSFRRKASKRSPTQIKVSAWQLAMCIDTKIWERKRRLK